MQTALPTGAPRFKLRLFLWGLLFEALFLSVSFSLPASSPLASELHNFALVIHTPVLFLLAMIGGSDGALAVFSLPFAFAAMGLFWALIFYGILRLKDWLSVCLVSTRQRLAARYSLVSLTVLIFIATVTYAWPQTPKPFATSAEASAAVDANTAFAVDLYQKLQERPGNLFFSPYSISSSLAMTYAGARGETESEMARMLHFGSAGANIHRGFRALTDRLNNLQRWNRITLLAANSLWYEQHYFFTNTFLEVAKQDYHAEVHPVDFNNAPAAAQKSINSWVEQKTDGKIQDALGADQLSPLTQLVLCNAIYFKGKWQTQFNPGDTRPAPFYVSSNQTVTVPMMWLHSHFKTVRSEDGLVQMLEMPYIGKDLSMIILLPNYEPEWSDLSDVTQPTFAMLEQNFTAANLHGWLSQLDGAPAGTANVSIPRFTTSQSFDLSETLKSMGMASAFDTNADFSGMDGTTNLYISDVLHKAYVQVDESGTEAAATTMTIVKTRGMPERFIANHPFIFLIRDNGSGTILFLGRVIVPTQ